MSKKPRHWPRKQKPCCLVHDSIRWIQEEDTGALFDHLQPVFGVDGRD
jgi:hypothetical protein